MVKHNEGYVPLYRKVKDKPWYKNIPAHVVFDHCLVSANWKQGELFDGTPVEIGSFITSYKKLADETGLSVGQVRRGLATLKTAQVVTHEATHQYSKITLINWGKYNPTSKSATKQATQEPTHEAATIEEYKETKEKRKMEDINNICYQLGFNYLSDDQFRQVQEIWLKNYSIGAIRDFVQIAKQHNAKNLFAYVNTMVHRTLEPAPRYDIDENKKELVDYNWWEEEE